jgi:hypothetical protein
MKAMLVGALAAAAAAVAGCGSQEASVLKSAFDHPIKSANIALSLDVKVAQKRYHTSLSGPFESNGAGKLPNFDWQLHITGNPRPIDGELISTGTDGFVRYGGRTYEVGQETMSQLQYEVQMAGSLKSADLTQLTRMMRDWFAQTSTQENARLDGEPVTRVTGQLDLSRALTDISHLAGNGKAISQKDIDEFDRHASDPRFTVDVGKSDGVLRRIVASVRLPAGSMLRLQLRYRDVNRPVMIDAPANGLPLSELQKRLSHDFGPSFTSSGGGSTS